MKNKEYLVLFLSAVVSLFSISVILYTNYLTDGKNLILENLSQGEVLAGIVIALPTIVTWMYSIKNEKDKEKKYISENALHIVKHYDSLLNEVVDDIVKENDEMKKLTIQRAMKIEYIIETFNKLFKELDAKTQTSISLNFSQVIPTITSIKHPNGIELPSSSQSSTVEQWKNSLSIALKPVINELIKNNQIKILEDPSVQYFSLINFMEEEMYFKKIEFKGKSFIQCNFSDNFLKHNKFMNCKFINCEFMTDSEVIKNKLFNDNKIIGDFEKNEKIKDNKSYDMENRSSTAKIIDTREGIVVDPYVMGQKYYQFEGVDLSNKEIKNKVIEFIKNEKDLNIADKNNKKISISKNYINKDNKREFLSNSIFSGWHSLFKEKIEIANNLKYYIFVVKDSSNYNFIVFKEDKLKEYLENKEVDRSGKYNFYFNGLKNEN